MLVRSSEVEQFFHSNVYMFKRKLKWTTAYQHVISRASHISFSIKGTFWYLSLVFLEWSTINFCYSSLFVSLGFTIRTARTQKKITEVSMLSSTIQLLQSDLLIKYMLDYKSRPPKFRADSKYCGFFSLALVHGAYEKPSSAVAQSLNKSKPNLPFLTVTDSFVKLKCVSPS